MSICQKKRQIRNSHNLTLAVSYQFISIGSHVLWLDGIMRKGRVDRAFCAIHNVLQFISDCSLASQCAFALPGTTSSWTPSTWHTTRWPKLGISSLPWQKWFAATKAASCFITPPTTVCCCPHKDFHCFPTPWLFLLGYSRFDVNLSSTQSNP